MRHRIQRFGDLFQGGRDVLHFIIPTFIVSPLPNPGISPTKYVSFTFKEYYYFYTYFKKTLFHFLNLNSRRIEPLSTTLQKT